MTIAPQGTPTLMSVRLSTDQLNTLKKIAEQEGLTLLSALRAGFLQYAENCG